MLLSALTVTSAGLLALVTLRLALVRVTVVGTSMEPYLRRGDHVLVFRAWPRRWLRRGHVVMVSTDCVPAEYRSKCDTWHVTPAVGGTKGRSMPPKPDNTNLVVVGRSSPDGHSFIVKRVHLLPGDPIPGGQGSIPSNSVFLQGDSVHSLDSRQWGAVRLSSFVGLVITKLVPKARRSHSPSETAGYSHAVYMRDFEIEGGAYPKSLDSSESADGKPNAD